MRFTDQLWVQTAPVYEAILRLPFLRELAAGTLSRESFVFYMKQDAMYLQDFSRALAITGGRLPVQHMQAFFEFAAGVAAVERVLHETYLKEFNATLDIERSPSCFAYTHFLLSTASLASAAEAVAALLPCFWIYREVGSTVAQKAQSGLASNPYARWIETYSGEAFDHSVQRAIAICDDVADAASENERALMLKAFDKSARLEWLFWDSAYRQEQWPPG